MALLTLPVDLPLTVHVGIGLHRQFVWKPDGQTGQDFTGWDALLLVGPRCGTAVAELDTAAGITLDTDGTITVALSAAVSQTLPTAGELHYQLDLIPPDPAPPVRFLTGRLSVVCGINRAVP